MTKQLIDGLRTAADWIESGKVEYDWFHWGKCNCGVLAQVITGFNATEVQAQLIKIGGWSDVHEAKLELPLIIKQMMKAGMKLEQFKLLEDLKDVQNINNSKELLLYKTHSFSAISYMRTWADSLERELLNQSTKHKPTTKVTVSC